MRCSNQELRIENAFVTVYNVLCKQRIHVMYEKFGVNIVTFYSEITTFISIDDKASCLLPLSGSVEGLVDPSVETERRHTYLAS
jgi:hypothetical protein